MADSRIRSISFPFKKGELAFPKEAVDAAAIKASVIQIVTTQRGERVMRPDFGCNAFSYVFESTNDSFRIKTEREIRLAITKWEPRVRVEAVKISTDDISEPGQTLITIVYTILSTGEFDSTTLAGGS